MTKARKEIPPDVQLLQLRKARDRYKALADRVRDDADILQMPEQKLARERDARRIAQAYEKSIENMIASCRIRRIDLDASESGSAAVKFALAAFFVVAAGGAVLAVARPAVPRAIVARIIGSATAVPSIDRGIPGGSSAEMIFPGRELPAATPSAPLVPEVPTAALHLAAPANPPVQVAQRLARKRGSADAGNGNVAGGGRIVVKVLQPDGTLKEQSFPSAPRH